MDKYRYVTFRSVEAVVRWMTDTGVHLQSDPYIHLMKVFICFQSDEDVYFKKVGVRFRSDANIHPTEVGVPLRVDANFYIMDIGVQFVSDRASDISFQYPRCAHLWALLGHMGRGFLKEMRF